MFIKYISGIFSASKKLFSLLDAFDHIAKDGFEIQFPTPSSAHIDFQKQTATLCFLARKQLFVIVFPWRLQND